jgi:hypothetical protein
MTIRSDSYSSVDGVLAWTRHLIEGQTTFNSTTTPRLTEVESFINEASGVLNLALTQEGFSTASVIANSTAKLACDNWVRGWGVSFVELASPMQGFGGDNSGRSSMLQGMHGSALEFVEDYTKGFKMIGVTQTFSDSNVIRFTGETLQADREDPANSALAQPHFKRGQFDNK